MMLSNLITAKSLDRNPASHASRSTVNTSRLFTPRGLDTPVAVFTCIRTILSLQHLRGTGGGEGGEGEEINK